MWVTKISMVSADDQCALPLLTDRIKQSIASCKQVAVFFRSRADIEEKCARSLSELCRTTGDVYSRADCKAGWVMAPACG